MVAIKRRRGICAPKDGAIRFPPICTSLAISPAKVNVDLPSPIREADRISQKSNGFGFAQEPDYSSRRNDIRESRRASHD